MELQSNRNQNALSLLCLHTTSLSPSHLSFPSQPSLSLFENLVLAYLPHDIFVVLSVSYKFICLTLPEIFCYCLLYASLITIV